MPMRVRRARTEPAAGADSRAKPRARGNAVMNAVLQIAATAAIGMLVYPDAASWVARVGHNAESSGYVRSVETTPQADRERILQAAYVYNDHLEPGPLTDPYISVSEDEARGSDVYRAYAEMLRVSGSDAIGTISYPRLDIGLPIYHGTADETISRGLGHMYGTSLPVGGPSTRSVMTAHSGLPSSRLLTDLPRAVVGDTFWISVLGEDHYYRVVSTETVLPGDTESLEIIEGEDWVTLFTCTPIGVNSHRFMVHAERIAAPDAADLSAVAGDGQPLGFPWWAVWWLGGSGAVAVLLFRRPRSRPEPAHATS